MNAPPDRLDDFPERRYGRRAALTLLAGGGAAALLAACGNGGTKTAESSTTTSTLPSGGDRPAGSPPGGSPPGGSGSASTEEGATPSETGGPFPADGSNDNGEGETADVLSDKRIVRSDIRADLDGANVQQGAPLDLTVNVVDATTKAAIPGAAVYVWHCTKDGHYSVYSGGMNGGDYSDNNYLRGVQVADSAGRVKFTTILPGRYSGRAFHIHFEVYGSDDLSEANKVLTSQMAMDDDVIDALYEAAGYDDSLRSTTHNADDNVFSDGVSSQLLTVTGDVNSGVTASITVAV